MIYFVKRDSSCDFHRSTLPARYLKLPQTNSVQEARVYYFNRIPQHDLAELKKRGVKLVCDVDDYWELYESHYLYKQFKKLHGPNILQSIQLADVVLTTNAKLADKISPFNKNVEVIPNALPYEREQFKLGAQPWTGKVKFIGGQSHLQDLSLIPGYPIPNQLHLSRYMDHYRGVNICLAPLLDNEFNQCKSNLKILEAACGYASIICSDMHPFRNPLDEDYVIYAKPSEWQDKIRYCQLNKNYTIETGLALGDHCRRHYDLTRVNEHRKDLLSELLCQG